MGERGQSRRYLLLGGEQNLTGHFGFRACPLLRGGSTKPVLSLSKGSPRTGPPTSVRPEPVEGPCVRGPDDCNRGFGPVSFWHAEQDVTPPNHRFTPSLDRSRIRHRAGSRRNGRVGIVAGSRLRGVPVVPEAPRARPGGDRGPAFRLRAGVDDELGCGIHSPGPRVLSAAP